MFGVFLSTYVRAVVLLVVFGVAGFVVMLLVAWLMGMVGVLVGVVWFKGALGLGYLWCDLFVYSGGCWWLVVC